MEKFLRVGIISSVHGVHGEAKVYPTTDGPERFKKIKEVYMTSDGTGPKYKVLGAKVSKGLAIVKLEGIDSPETMMPYLKRELYISRDQAQPLGKDENYIADLIGMDVFLEDGSSFGRLTDVLDTAANDVYVIESKEHGEVLVPAIKQCILDVDVMENRMTIHLLEGLLEL